MGFFLLHIANIELLYNQVTFVCLFVYWFDFLTSWIATAKTIDGRRYEILKSLLKGLGGRLSKRSLKVIYKVANSLRI